MRNLRIAGVLGFCFLLGFVLMAMVGCSTDQTEKIDVPQSTTIDTETDLSAIDAVDPVDTGDPADTVDTVTPASLFAFEFDDKGNPIIQSGDWGQWGGTSYRNNTPVATGIPIDWSVGRLNRETGVWANQKNIKWV